MSERRDFLKAASLLPLTAVGAAATGKEADPADSSQSTTSALPKTETVQEQRFENYHLLGKPDQKENLFGGNRPADWRTTKNQLRDAILGAAHEGDPIHRWLKTFELGFDERAGKIVLNAAANTRRNPNQPELRYEPQLYEASLRGAAALLDRCLRYRNEMGGFEVAGIGAGISYLTFIKLRPVQRNFIIQSGSSDLDEIEKVAQTLTSQNYAQAKGVDRLIEKYHLRALQVEAEGNAAEARLAGAKDRLRTHLLEKQFNVQSDAQLAQLTRLLTPGSSSNYAERYLRMLAMLTEDLADAYRKLYSASKGVQQVLGIKQVSVGIDSPISIDIPLFTAGDQIKAWVKAIVPPQEGDQRKPDILDALVLWVRAVMRELDTRSQYETEFTVAIPLNQPWGPNGTIHLSTNAIQAAFNPSSGTATGKVTFTLAADALPFSIAPANVRVIGIGLAVEHSQDDAGPVQYASTYPGTPVTRSQVDPAPGQVAAVQALELPKMARLNATVTTPPQTLAGDAPYSRPAVFLANVRLQGGTSGDLEPRLSFDPVCHNLNPFGDWTIAFDPNAMAWYQTAAKISESWIAGLILYLRLRGSLQ